MGAEYIHLRQGFQFWFTVIIIVDYFWGANLGEKFRQTCLFGNTLSVNLEESKRPKSRTTHKTSDKKVWAKILILTDRITKSSFTPCGKKPWLLRRNWNNLFKIQGLFNRIKITSFYVILHIGLLQMNFIINWGICF